MCGILVLCPKVSGAIVDVKKNQRASTGSYKSGIVSFPIEEVDVDDNSPARKKFFDKLLFAILHGSRWNNQWKVVAFK